jgi:L-alanine-DL-glutamate epimerase-like enolase superfamily enzyme
VRAALDLLTPRLVGRDCFDIEAILADLDAVLVGNGPAKAGIDGALHDLAARLLDVPLNRLFGGVMRRVIPQIRIVPIKGPAEMAEASAALVAQGYRYLKIKLKGDIALDVERIARIRDAVGPDVRLTLDPNQSYTPKAAIQALTRMEPFSIDLVEQPVPAEDLAGLALVTRNVPIAVEADEAAITVSDVFALVANRTIDAVSLKIPKLGGLRNTMLAARICETGKVRYRLGATFGPRLHAAQALHLAAAFPRLDYACELAEFDHLREDPYEGLQVVDGAIAVPEGPGSGVSLRKGASLAA